MPEWKYGKNSITLSELTEEALEKFLADDWLSVFLTNETKDVIRQRFKEFLENENNKKDNRIRI